MEVTIDLQRGWEASRFSGHRDYGLVCRPMPHDRGEALAIQARHPQVDQHQARRQLAFEASDAIQPIVCRHDRAAETLDVLTQGIPRVVVVLHDEDVALRASHLDEVVMIQRCVELPRRAKLPP